MESVNNRSRSSSGEWDAASEAADARGEPACFESSTSNPSRAGEETLASPNPAVRALVDAYPTATGGPAPAEATLPAANNASRTMPRDSTEPYAETGRTENGDWFAGAAALKTRDPKTFADAEVFTASIQVGDQNEVQAGLARVGYGGERDGVIFSVGVEALTARANLGIRSDDGSEGANVGAMATGAGVEATLGYSGWSVTAGLSISAGAAVSSGERNVDDDDVPERCFKASIGPSTLGFCSEL